MVFYKSIFSTPMELFEGCSRERILIAKMNANKVEVNETFIAESLKHECLWDVKARAYKDYNAR